VGPDLSLQSATFDAMPDLPESFTVEFWFRAGQQVQGAFPVLCAKPAGNMLAGEASYAFILINGNGNLIFRVTTDTGNFEIQYPHNLLDNQWHHVAGVRTVGSTARIYLFVDGRPYDYLSIVGTTLTSTEPLCIGRLEFTGYTGNQFDGDLDELRLWGVARSAAEIDRDRFREISSAPGLIVAFHFDGFYETDSGQRIHLGTPFPEKATHVNPAGAGGLLSGPDGAPVVPGSGFDGSQSFRTVGGKTPSDVRYMHAAAMSGGQFVALGKQTAASPFFLEVGQMNGANPVWLGELAIDLPLAAAVQADHVYAVTEAGTTDRLYDYSVTNPSAPSLAQPALTIPFKVMSAVLDPMVAGRLWVAGNESTNPIDDYPNRVQVIDATGGFHILFMKGLGTRSTFGILREVGVTSQFLAASFDDGVLRTYQHPSVSDTNLVLTDQLYLGSIAQVAAIPGSGDFAVATSSSMFILDPATGSVPALASLDIGQLTGLTVAGQRAYVSGDDGVHVFDVGPGYPLDEVAWWATEDRPYSDPAVDETTQRVYLAAYYAGLYGLKTMPVVAAEGRELPSSGVSLHAFPNPMRERVSLTLRLPFPTTARVDVFDVAGRCVRHLAAHSFPAGEQRLAWDGRDDQGRATPPGIYFYRAGGDGWSETLRLARVE